DAGNGGQVVMSEATAVLVGRSLPEGTSLVDLGKHRFKDLADPETILQLSIDGLPTEFGPLRTLDAVPNNLPVQLTSFVGREAELAEATRLLEGTRVLTLTGPGGTGKTRMALQLAAEVSDRFSPTASTSLTCHPPPSRRWCRPRSSGPWAWPPRIRTTSPRSG